MEIKLCYKVYSFSFTLGACKQFFDNAGEDLQLVLLRYIQTAAETSEMNLLQRMNTFLGVVNFDTAAQAIHALIKTENASIPLDEVRDGMFRVSWLPSDRTDDLSEPWPMVMLSIAVQVNDYFNQNLPVKKKATRRKPRKKTS